MYILDVELEAEDVKERFETVAGSVLLQLKTAEDEAE